MSYGITKTLTKLLGCGWLILSLSGCAVSGLLTSYPNEMASVKEQLNSGSASSVVPQLTDKMKSSNPLLYAQEAGRAAQITGDFAGSIALYDRAINGYVALDERAKVSLSHVGANTGSLLVNDKVIPYEGNLSERILLHQYQALNYLFKGDSTAAQVEMRRTNELQQLQQQQLDQQSKTAQQLNNGEISAEVSRLKSIGDTPLNGGSYYVTGLLHELFGQPNDAYIDYRKAANVLPDNPVLQQALLRLAQSLSMPQLEEFTQRWGNPVQPKSSQGRVVLMLERGFVTPKTSFTLPLVIDNSVVSLSLPTYREPGLLPAVPATLFGSNTLSFTPLTQFTQIEAAELSDRLPFIYTRQAGRLAAKAMLAHQTQGESTGALLGNALMQIFNVVTEQADCRSWLTLPAQLDLLDNFTEQGQYQLHYGDYQQPVTVQAGRTTLVWIIDTGNLTRFYTKLL
ncbi:COG3014 family protein [Shewanella sp.]|uniref:COG3014 family protein n=1 Tax=Shewanella sp. TaxID=50422 RepID=UPI003A9858FD